MSRFVRFTVPATLIAIGLLGGLVLTSCDLASAGSTIVLNAGDIIPPIVQHRFAYTGDEATDDGQVEVVSTVTSERDLDDVLEDNGYSRDDVVSARVDSVRVDPVSTSSLSAAKIYLGTDVSGPRIASVEFSADQGKVVDATQTGVTEAVKAGETDAFGEFSLSDPSSLPSGGSVVRATIFYRIKVE